MGTGSFPGVKSGRGVTLTAHPLLVPWSWKGRAIPLLPPWAVRPVQSLSVCTRVHFTFIHLRENSIKSEMVRTDTTIQEVPLLNLISFLKKKKVFYTHVLGTRAPTSNFNPAIRFSRNLEWTLSQWRIPQHHTFNFVQLLRPTWRTPELVRHEKHQCHLLLNAKMLWA